MYSVTKTYDHNLGLSTCFRQWAAESHCRYLHGYPLAFKLVFTAQSLNKNNWVLDFGGLKPVKEFLVYHFDHTLCIAQDDPLLDDLMALQLDGLAQAQILPMVGCEGFATFVFDWVNNWLARTFPDDVADRGLAIACVECREHSANSAIYYGK